MSTFLIIVGIFVALAALNALVEVASKALASRVSERTVRMAGYVPILVALVTTVGGGIAVYVARLNGSILPLAFYVVVVSLVAVALLAATIIHHTQNEHAVRRAEEESLREQERQHQDWLSKEPERRRVREEAEREHRTFEYINSLSGQAFERHVERTFSRLGYQVRRVGGTGDQGVDHIIRKGRITTAVQCKRYQGVVGNGAVQEAISGSLFHKCSNAMVVTTSTFSKSAKELARRASVELIDGEAYMKMVGSTAQDLWKPKPDNTANQTDDTVPF
jgi:hypothetical protein